MSGFRIEVEREIVTLPNGRRIELDMIRHPGASAVVLWSLFEEQIVHDEEQALALAEFHSDSFGEAVGG